MNNLTKYLLNLGTFLAIIIIFALTVVSAAYGTNGLYEYLRPFNFINMTVFIAGITTIIAVAFSIFIILTFILESLLKGNFFD